ncbi:RND transporter [Sphingomonas sp. ABOLD]|uniref:NodT family efflux transporter outer membrane factor (OMF) lipoprotein n=1 Tax=Sphingomonas trueperi TaxID=53317 RepID=A0A7X6BDJ5_9SPHN|nr:MULTISPECIES: efflux transporter outer membrane subunit [Sphingomonas]NJB98673.1 NodT family efflux transporter outer membrane factor (OMF) lipoprotein [Sphingomonas trueperi]RSV43948.1 RND transporter [Sphingomonas sp. ABOLE]RSV45847.1 RND transporter [Sphingomonas sp. ABOLD]
MARPALALLLCAALPLAACSTGSARPQQSPAPIDLPDRFSVDPQQQAREDLARWWDRFDDPMLGQLIGQAQTANLDIAQAVIRLRQARESLVQSRSALLPTVRGSAGYSRNEPLRGGSITTQLPDGTIGSFSQGGSSNFSLGLDASYQADLFGGVRSGVRSARASFEAAGFNRAAVLLSVESETARNYVQARLSQAQLANARESLAIQDENLQIAQWRVQAGLVSSLDAEQARAQRSQTAASIPQLESSYAANVARLGVLTGQTPGALREAMAAPKPIPRGPASVAAGIPADALRQRPDVRAAERNLAAASAQIGVSRAQLYPSLSLGGSISSGSSSVRSLLDLITGRAFANVAQTIFDSGRLRSQLRSARAGADGAFYSYKASVLQAMEEIENAIVALQAAREREAAFRTALEAATNQALLARFQYRSGLTDFTTLNQSESALLSAKNGLSQAESEQATALIQLYVALGGGWDEAAPIPPLPPRTGSATDGQ